MMTPEDPNRVLERSPWGQEPADKGSPITAFVLIACAVVTLFALVSCEIAARAWTNANADRLDWADR